MRRQAKTTRRVTSRYHSTGRRTSKKRSAPLPSLNPIPPPTDALPPQTDTPAGSNAHPRPVRTPYTHTRHPVTHPKQPTALPPRSRAKRHPTRMGHVPPPCPPNTARTGARTDRAKPRCPWRARNSRLCLQTAPPHDHSLFTRRSNRPSPHSTVTWHPVHTPPSPHLLQLTPPLHHHSPLHPHNPHPAPARATSFRINEVT